MNRRAVLAGLGSIGLTSIAGCLGTIGMAEHTASPGGVEQSVLEETGYVQAGIDDLTIEEEIDLSVYSETVVVENYITEYQKSVDLGPLGEQEGAMFAVLSTPQITVAGRNFNPIEDYSSREIVEMVAANYDGLGNISLDGEDSVEILGETTIVSRFTATAEFDGVSVDVNMHVSEAVAADGDLLVALGVYPRQVESLESQNILQMTEGIITGIEYDPESQEGNDSNTTNADAGGESNSLL